LLQHVARCRIEPLQLVAEDEHLAAGRLEQPGDHIEQSALAAAGRSYDSNEFAFLDFEVDVLNRGIGAEAHRHVVQVNGGCRSGLRLH